MIVLNIEPYCHGCNEFDPKCVEQTVICKYRKLCARLYERLQEVSKHDSSLYVTLETKGKINELLANDVTYKVICGIFCITGNSYIEVNTVNTVWTEETIKNNIDWEHLYLEVINSNLDDYYFLNHNQKTVYALTRVFREGLQW